MNMHDLNIAIAQQLKAITGDAGAFVVGLLSDDISKDDQITFALRLAEHIKERADSTAGMVIEGGVLDDGGSGRPALPAATNERVDHPCPADDD
ncbi:hypothetical protein SSPO_026970 [Streptomyces antimycoticus]|uniref:Uncharacterized protein n=1 Tax=Streptomyces antimycoticus TaxID=68175 RepID=A0A499UST9_9ACTN|nr:hypothetical protein [Streptomyces antimycoticus]BBJ39979.1 hypothetical protein SSPO_026970 [Streptomyces antimycoticus]